MAGGQTKTAQQRLMPNNLEAEQSLLACILINDDVANDVVPGLKKEDFYGQAHQLIFQAMFEIYMQNKPVDLVTVSDTLEREGNLKKIGGIEYISSLSVMLPSSASYKYYRDIVIRDSILRKLINSAEKIIENAYESKDANNSLALAEKYVFDISKDRDKSSLLHIGTALNEAIERIEIAFKDKSKLSGLSSGYGNLDMLTDGLQKSDLILIAARPGFGKTTFALNIVANMAARSASEGDKKVCAIFSLEMPAVQLVQRLLCCISKTSMSDAKKGDLDDEDFKRLHKASVILNNSDIFIDDTSVTSPGEILSKCRRLFREKGRLDLVVVDYLQLMNSPEKKDSRQQEVSEISRMMKIIAKELNVPLLLISQLSRAIDQRKDDKRPKLSDLRESGAIEQDADIVMFIHKDDANAALSMETVEKIQLIVAKHRNGEVSDKLRFNFIRPFLKFEELATDFANDGSGTVATEYAKSKDFTENSPKGSGDIIIEEEINEIEAEAFESQYKEDSEHMDYLAEYQKKFEE